MNDKGLDAVFGSVVEFVRENYPDEIDTAYEYFWEEDYPEDFLGGTALSLGFMNFEDWMICDYRRDDGTGFIDQYISETAPGDEAKKALLAMKDSMLAFYEVKESSESAVKLLNLHNKREIGISDPKLAGLAPGELFVSRMIELDGAQFMGRCVYPFKRESKDTVLEYLDVQFDRYIKNKNPEGSVESFMKNESYVFNVIWVTMLFKHKPKDTTN